ncbi:hypothetical protein N4G69_25095 [Streptomyces mirabilis]|uniref:hypothetical protein n=1 Tax=Streptomyces mirabilis TaxID=68239 RepID=UPI0021C1BCC1|nr:hypothetical protein [Streptomyces mirabilis]MCT9108856.1 hypothetical protein [Streptomyces mirabilis]
MTTRTDVIDHAARRLVVGLATPYDAAREHYETLVPEADLGRFSDTTSWQATLELAEINAPHGFMRYYRSDITAVMNGSASCWKATEYLMGNHTIAERMYRHDPSVMLHAPPADPPVQRPRRQHETGHRPAEPAVRQLRRPAHHRRRP